MGKIKAPVNKLEKRAEKIQSDVTNLQKAQLLF